MARSTAPPSKPPGGDDTVDVEDSVLNALLKLDGGKGNDTFTDRGGNTIALTPKFKGVETII